MCRRRYGLIISSFGLLACVGTIIFVHHFIDEPSGYRFEFAPKKSRNLPDCIIFGAKKGGTRALLEFINLHPDVEISPREVHHFNFDNQYKRGLDWYRSQMPLVSKEQLTIEKSPNYFISRVTPQRIYKMNKNIKLILAVREPVERSISDYVQSYSGKNKSFVDQAFIGKNFSVVNTRWWPIRISNYASQMKKWLDVFPLKQILVVECAALTSDPALQMQRVEKFLGLEPYITSSNFYFNPAKGFMCWRHDESDPGRCLGDGKGRKHPPVDHAAVVSLRKYFAKSNRLFYKQVGYEFDWPKN